MLSQFPPKSSGMWEMWESQLPVRTEIKNSLSTSDFSMYIEANCPFSFIQAGTHSLACLFWPTYRIPSFHIPCHVQFHLNQCNINHSYLGYSNLECWTRAMTWSMSSKILSNIKKQQPLNTCIHLFLHLLKKNPIFLKPAKHFIGLIGIKELQGDFPRGACYWLNGFSHEKIRRFP